jgi:GTP cyclohydrolase I
MVNIENIEALIAQLLTEIGEDPNRAGLVDTPRRVARFWAEFIDEEDNNLNTTFESVEADQMVVAKGITGWSLCEHHLLPFSFTASVGYIPNGKILGLSKFPRLIRHSARKLHVQEALTKEIADLITELTHSEDVAVRVEGEHLCTVMRGVKAEGTKLATQDIRGKFRSDHVVRHEFLNLVV